MLFTGLGRLVWEKNCALGLECDPWPSVSGRTQDLGHSLFKYKTSRPVNNIYIVSRQTEAIVYLPRR